MRLLDIAFEDKANTTATFVTDVMLTREIFARLEPKVRAMGSSTSCRYVDGLLELKASSFSEKLREDMDRCLSEAEQEINGPRHAHDAPRVDGLDRLRSKMGFPTKGRVKSEKDRSVAPTASPRLRAFLPGKAAS